MPNYIKQRHNVEAITSKLSNHTIIPIQVVEHVHDFLAANRAKQFDIIAGHNPFDEMGEEVPAHTRPASSVHVNASPDDLPTRRGGRWSTGRSPPREAPKYAKRTIPGWAAERLQRATPYTLLRSADLQHHGVYLLDEEDLQWCRIHHYAAEMVCQSIGFLEWAYVSSVLASTSRDANGEHERGRHTATAASSSSSITNKNHHHNNNTCAVCAKPFSLLHHNASVEAMDAVDCTVCGVRAHVWCWGLSEPLKHVDGWTCDGCHAAEQRERRRNTTTTSMRCSLCQRTGGVLFHFQSFINELDGRRRPRGGEGGSGVVADAATPALMNGAGGAVGEFCHAVCGLAWSELELRAVPTQLRRNGFVDMQHRPVITATRRLVRPKHPIHCLYCQEDGGHCIRCSHPMCFELMHPSCAVASHKFELLAEDAPAGEESHAGSLPRQEVVDAHLYHWRSCSVFCPNHYGLDEGNAFGSLPSCHTNAERAAIDADLRELISQLLVAVEEGKAPAELHWADVKLRRGPGRPPAGIAAVRATATSMSEDIRGYWLERRARRRRESATMANDINAHKLPMLAAALRPEIVKLSLTKVRLSHLFSLIPEWQHHLVSTVEGELPIADEEYEDVQRYRKVASQTRRAGRPDEALRERLMRVESNVATVSALCSELERHTAHRSAAVDLEARHLMNLCEF